MVESAARADTQLGYYSGPSCVGVWEESDLPATPAPLFTQRPRRGVLGTSRRSMGSGIMFVVERVRTRLERAGWERSKPGCTTS